MQFFGTIFGLIKKFGFSKLLSAHIFDSFQETYSVSIDWTKRQIKKAHKKGYVVGAYGLRLKTPLLKRTVYGDTQVPYAAVSEFRTAANMLSGQSYGLMTINAFYEFMKIVYEHPEYKYKIRPVITIYDAIYIELDDDDPKQLKFVNDTLIRCMADISKLPELKHKDITMSSTLSLYAGTMATEVEIPNNASLKDIKKIMGKR